MSKKNITRPAKGLHQDSSPQDQPKGTHRFALNAIVESQEGDINFISNEESNEICTSLKPGYIPVGKVYIGGGNTVILSVNADETLDEIGILDDACNYVPHAEIDLGLKVSHQIDIIYRLRRGCERVIYFTDDLNNPRSYNFDKPEDFKTVVGALPVDFLDVDKYWDVNKFKLFKRYEDIPSFDSFEILETGNLLPGSYNFSIQYLDGDLNPTENITTTETIIIYNDSVAKRFEKIRGSSNVKTAYQDFGNTNKAIKINLSNLDTSYPFYRIGIIEANNSDGQVSKVSFSGEISVETTSFTYTGDNAPFEGTEIEIQIFDSVIEKAKHIEQIENRLTLSGVKGPEINYCNLQKCASAVKADLVTKTINLSTIESESNQKRGTLHTESVGYMPGEIYSFGLVYVFADGSVSPALHIPGKNPNYVSQMSDDNEDVNETYIDNNICQNVSAWGVDSEGDVLKGVAVRHHRFPLRSEVKLPLIEGSTSELTPQTTYTASVILTGAVSAGYTKSTFWVEVKYTKGGVTGYTYRSEINVNDYTNNGNTWQIDFFSNTTEVLSWGFGVGSDIVQELDPDSLNPIAHDPAFIPNANPPYVSDATKITYVVQINTGTTNNTVENYTSQIMGIKFSGIKQPALTETGGKQVVGYYIVRQERTEVNKTILDNAILTPLVKQTYYVGFSHLLPDFTTPANKIQKDAFGMISPEHLFLRKEHKNTTKIIQEGVYSRARAKTITNNYTQDVMAGTSYDSSISERREKDSDGFSLHTVSRNNDLKYERADEIIAEEVDIEEIFSLDSLENKNITDIDDDEREIYNISADNRIEILQLNTEIGIAHVDEKLPYVVLKRELDSPYGNFRTSAYYTEVPVQSFPTADEEVEVFNGDSYITPLRYHNTFHYDTRLRYRESKSGLWNTIIGVVAILGGAIAAVYGAGTAAITLIGFGMAQLQVGFKKEKIAKVYSELYEQGLRECATDNDTNVKFAVPNPIDDELQWFSDTLTNLWVESSVNMNWRQGTTIGLPDFLDSPDTNTGGVLDSYMLEKLTTLDASSENGRLYTGYTNPELYEINLDYLRRNKQKTFYHLPIEYDCCSDCIEHFPLRVHWSEQSFQEELSDNYRVFLPNNYKDIEGETGVITNVYRIQNNLYLHTEEAIWHLPQNIQERVTGDIISFIGTGEFFSIPPRKILDDANGNSAGTQHKWSMLKTPQGVYFPSENQRAFYQFDGQSLNPISNQGLFTWFKNNTDIKLDTDYYELNTREFPYRDNPSNLYGTGFIATYDSRKERIIFTKKDLVFGANIVSSGDYEICVKGNELTLFEDFEADKAAKIALNWNYDGMVDCEMQFSREASRTYVRNIVRPFAANTDFVFQIDISANESYADSIAYRDAVGAFLDNEWLPAFTAKYPWWTGTFFFHLANTILDSERWVNLLPEIVSVTDIFTYNLGSFVSYASTLSNNIVAISLVSGCNDLGGNTRYTPSTPVSLLDVVGGVQALFVSDYLLYKTAHTTQTTGGTFKGLVMPLFNLAKEDISGRFVEHVMAAQAGGLNIDYAGKNPYEDYRNNPNIYSDNWENILANVENEGGASPIYNTTSVDASYTPMHLDNWRVIPNKIFTTDATPFELEQFMNDVDNFLTETNGVNDTETITEFYTEYDTIAGVVIAVPDTENNSWTISYALKLRSWTSWHSYLPNFYIHTPEKFYSWIQGNDNIWKHNKLGSYHNFYGVGNPHIIEYVALSEPLQSKIWDDIMLHVEAKKYNAATDSYVDERFKMYNKGIFYNTRQCTGELGLIVKDTQANPEDYMSQQVVSPVPGTILIDRNERNWTMNDLRDIRIDYVNPIWDNSLTVKQADYYIDKVLNTSTLDVSKDWTELESLRDKYLVIRLIFDNFEDIKLIMNYSIETETDSLR